MSTIAKILEIRRKEREAELQLAEAEKEGRREERKANLAPIIEFLKETEADPQYGPLLAIEIDPDYWTIQISPSEAAYETISTNNGGEHIDDFLWGNKSISVKQINPIGSEPHHIVINGNYANCDGKVALPNVQYAVANLLENIIDFSTPKNG